jgi:hypothetical protein
VSSAVNPFAVLNLLPTDDKKEIKRAYKRMALHYHPDMLTNQKSSIDDKKRANDAFAEINWAYAQLSGKNGDTSNTYSTSSSSSSSSSDWREPKYEEDQQNNAGGDSFDKKLEDIFNGGEDMFRDYEELLQVNADGYSNGEEEDDDAQLQILLKTGSIEQVGMAMYDMESVVQHLDNKRRNLADELVMRQANRKSTYLYMEQKQVVDGDLKKARNRLLVLQTRYKQLVYLQVSVNGYPYGEEDDAQLQMLLQTGSIEQVGMEMYDSELVAEQLDTKRRNLADELVMRQDELASTRFYLEKKELEKMVATLKVENKSADENVKKARHRLLAMQTRYKQLVMEQAHVVDGYSNGEKKDEEDTQLQILLKTGSVEQVGMEMKDTQLMLQQLDRKRSNMADELVMLDREITSTYLYLEKRELEQMVVQVEAKQQVVDELVKKARNRLLALQTRYEQLVSYSSSRSTSFPYSRTTSSSSSKRGTYSNGRPFHYQDMPNTRDEQQPIADISWTIRLKDNVTADTLSYAEKEMLEAATWPYYEFRIDQQAHCIASRMLNEYLENPHRDKWSPPVPNPRNQAEAAALKVVEFSPSSAERSTRTARP